MLIGVTGKSGEGKSTFARSLTQNLIDAECIHCDDIMISIFLSQKDKLIELYGESIISNDGLNRKLFIQYPENIKTIHNLTDSTINEKLLSILNAALKKHKYVIIDSFRLADYEEIWNLCYIHILIKSESESHRYSHLLQRLNNSKSYKSENGCSVTTKDLELRDELSSDYNLFSYDFIVTNNYDENFFEEAKKIAIKLQNLNL